jgi:hypothetical protein
MCACSETSPIIVGGVSIRLVRRKMIADLREDLQALERKFGEALS